MFALIFGQPKYFHMVVLVADVQERGDAQYIPGMCRSHFILTVALWVSHSYYSRGMDGKEAVIVLLQ